MIACDAQSLQTGASGLQNSIPPGSQLAVLISLFCQMANVSCDPQSLVTKSVCQISCLPPGTQLAILISLACQLVNNGGSGGGVTSIVAGTNVTISPPSGTGAVTINASGGGGTAQLVEYTSGTPANPPNIANPAIAYDPTGNLPIFGWNTVTQTWN